MATPITFHTTEPNKTSFGTISTPPIRFGDSSVKKTKSSINYPSFNFSNKIPNLPKLPPISVDFTSGVMNTLVLLLAASSTTWVPLMVLGGKNKNKSKKINKKIYNDE